MFFSFERWWHLPSKPRHWVPMHYLVDVILDCRTCRAAVTWVFSPQMKNRSQRPGSRELSVNGLTVLSVLSGKLYFELVSVFELFSVYSSVEHFCQPYMLPRKIISDKQVEKCVGVLIILLLFFFFDSPAQNCEGKLILQSKSSRLQAGLYWADQVQLVCLWCHLNWSADMQVTT